MKTRRIALLVKFLAGIGGLLASSSSASAAAEANSTEKRRHRTTTTTTTTADAEGVEAARPIAILVMAVGRSGSSMVGEFFRESEVCVLISGCSMCSVCTAAVVVVVVVVVTHQFHVVTEQALVTL